jgi:poly(glycerol-phosphate) alpha-glucosyltransferase
VKVLHTYAFSTVERGGGISTYLPPLLRASYEQGVETEWVSQSWPDDGPVEPPSEYIPLHLAATRDPTGFGYSGELKGLVDAAAKRSDILHGHGTWMYIDYLTSRAAHETGNLHVFSPQGSLEPWALARSRWKKAPVRMLFADRALRRVACVHATNHREAENIRALGSNAPIAVIPNGIEPESFAELPEREVFVERFPEVEDKKIFLFLSRIHPKKGPLRLAEAWGTLAKEYPNWHLVIAGNDEIGHRAEVEQALAAYGVADRTTFTGPMIGADELVAMSAADLFVLPSLSEGFSMVVLEAMASGLPVLLTPGCNFPEAAAAGAALETTPDARGVEEGLRRLMGTTDGERREMGGRGRDLATTRYTWERVVRDLKQVYEWCLGGGPVPPAMRTDRVGKLRL